MISGRTAIERMPAARCSLRNKTTSALISRLLATHGLASRTARAVMVLARVDPSWSVNLSRISSRNSLGAPTEAIGTIFCLVGSTKPIQIILKPPSSVAMRHASLKSSSRSRTRTMSALIPLNMACTRLS